MKMEMRTSKMQMLMNPMSTGKLLVAVAASMALSAWADDFASYVDPFTGTAGTGHTHPSACVPFGMVQSGPDTGFGNWAYCSGYQYRDKAVLGYSQTHLSWTARRSRSSRRASQRRTST